LLGGITMVLEYDGKIPTIDETAFIHDMAFVLARFT